MTEPPVVEVSDLAVRFRQRERTIHAVTGVSFRLGRGEVLGILGESGSGKSVTLRALMRLLPANCEIDGRVAINGEDVTAAPAARLEELRGGKVALIFQELAIALDPVFTIGEQIGETIVRHEGVGRRQARQQALELLERVQIPYARRRLDSYPHEMSGGMRQRAMIALALSCNPSVLLADEPTTALDVTVQIQILLLLRALQRELGMAVIFVTHDVGAAVEVSDRLAVSTPAALSKPAPCVPCSTNAHTLHRGAAQSEPARRRARYASADYPGIAAEPRFIAARLQFRGALCLCARSLPHDRAAAGCLRRRPPRPLPAGRGTAEGFFCWH